MTPDHYRVQSYDPADADLPSRGWNSIGVPHHTQASAERRMNSRRANRPDWPPMRVVRVRTTHDVVATEPNPT